MRTGMTEKRRKRSLKWWALGYPYVEAHDVRAGGEDLAPTMMLTLS